MKPHRYLTALLCAAALSSCGTNAVQDITGPVAGANIKFFNFGVNAPGVNFYANTTKMTAIGSTSGVESTTGTVSGGAGSGGFYSTVAAGQYTLTAKIAAATDKDLAISTVTATIADGKSYSFYMSGFYDATAKTVEGFVVEDPVAAAIDFSVAYVRFVNAISNAAPMTLYARNSTTAAEVPIGAAIGYKNAGAFTALPSGVYDLNTRLAGGTANIISRTAVSFSSGRVYTVGARGDITITSTTAATRPQLENTANR